MSQPDFKTIYEQGRRASIQAKTLTAKTWDLISRSNWFPLAIVLAALFFSVWFYGRVIGPVISRFNGVTPSALMSPVKEEFHLLKGTPPAPGVVTVIKIPAAKEETQIHVDGKGGVMASVSGVSKITYKPWFDWQPRFGVGGVCNPAGDGVAEILCPAVFFSPVEIAGRVDLDVYASTKNFGGGASMRLPFRMVSNTYLGGGVAVPYDDIKKIGVGIWVKVNF